MTIVNLTPHAVALNTGETFAPSGNIARVAATYSDPDERGVCKVGFGAVTGVPEAQDGTLYVVSALVSQALPDRTVRVLCVRAGF